MHQLAGKRKGRGALTNRTGRYEKRLLYVKENAAALLAEAFDKPGYVPAPIAVGVNTDAWQPLERKLGITRAILEVLLDCHHPCYLITKSALIERDIDILAALAGEQLVTASITITTLDKSLSRCLEPRASAPHRRLRTIERLATAGIPVRVSISPIIPALNEMEIETIVREAACAGAECAWAIPLRLPHELPELFEEWLEQHCPLKKERVLNGVREIRGGKLNDTRFGFRMRGNGPRAELIARRLELACRRAGIACGQHPMQLRSDRFTPPRRQLQGDLFN
ncbi:MAG: radical SAM protein [Gammaproteobacteria bacterium]|nr:MAG: radical SAM protein [Gammaproteobacteria bacterium]